MRTIITGSKTVVTYQDLLDAIDNAPFKVTSIVSGIIHWGDALGERYANENDLSIERIEAEVFDHRNRAEYLRMVDMIDHADALIVLWSGMSNDMQVLSHLAHSRSIIIIFIWHVKAISDDEIKPLIPW